MKTEKRAKKDRSIETKVDLVTCSLCSERLLLRFEQGAGESFNPKASLHKLERCGNAAWATSWWCGNATRTAFVSMVREHRRNDIGLSGAGTPDRHRTRTQVSSHREKGTLCVTRTCFQDWERLIAKSLRGRGAQRYSPLCPDLEAEGKEGRPRTLKRARPTSFLLHVKPELALGLILKAPPAYQTRRISTPG